MTNHNFSLDQDQRSSQERADRVRELQRARLDGQLVQACDEIIVSHMADPVASLESHHCPPVPPSCGKTSNAGQVVAMIRRNPGFFGIRDDVSDDPTIISWRRP